MSFQTAIVAEVQQLVLLDCCVKNKKAGIQPAVVLQMQNQ